jgi:hypothetical protein
MDEHDIETLKRFSVNQLERMMRTKFEAFSDYIMRKTGAHDAEKCKAASCAKLGRMMPKSVRRFSDNIMRKTRGYA